MIPWLALAPIALVAILTPPSAEAHAFAPSLLELKQTEADTFTVRFKQPVVRRSGSELRPILPASCEATGTVAIEPEGTGLVATWPVRCDEGLVGRTIAVEGIAESQADVLLRLELGERSVRHVLTADRPAFVVPEEESVWSVMRGYGILGVEHILFGFDHLLFVLGLVLLVSGGRRLLLTVTAFTLGHSITLALAALGLVHLPSAPIEALIAFSIYVLAIELARRHLRGEQEGETGLGRSPWWMAAGFGLLHGLGFAGALSEIGLPQGEIPAALLAFNAGIELGQLAFVAVVLAVGMAIRRLPTAMPRWAALVPAYFIGTLAAFWTLERVIGSF